MDLKFLIVILIFAVLIFAVSILIVRLNSRNKRQAGYTGTGEEHEIGIQKITVSDAASQKEENADTLSVKRGKKMNLNINDNEGSHIDIILLDDDTVYVIKQGYFEPKAENMELLDNAITAAKQHKEQGRGEAGDKTSETGDELSLSRDNNMELTEDDPVTLFDEISDENITKKHDLEDPGIESDAALEHFLKEEEIN